MQLTSFLLTGTNCGFELVRDRLWQFSLNATILAQQTDADLVANFRQAFSNFIESGQVWAFIIGIILGYLLRQFTTYGG